ncbi:MAG: hypothetical protein II453_01235 [Alphaproteobacteria bacterium]|nr:hypothetical protein [Alphaproteobacteria bacterium]
MEKTKIQTIDIKGKKYATVDSRVEFFREKFPAWSLETDYPVLDLDKGVCVCRAVVKDENGKIVADGFAHEWQSKPGSMVNKTSYIENAQTSAVGRALGFIGIGINGMGIATAEEVQTAIEHQQNNDIPNTDQSINDLVGDEIPFVESKRPDPDNWMSVNAFAGEMERCNDVSHISALLNSQKGNPKLKELIPLASARKQEILNNMQMGV